MRDVEPAAVQVGGADLHQAGHRHFFDFTELAEVHRRDRRDARTTAGAGGSGRGFLGLLQHGLDVGLHVFLQHAAVRAGGLDLGQLDAEFAGQLANRRTCVDLGAAGAGRYAGGFRGGGGQRGDGRDLGSRDRMGTLGDAVHRLFSGGRGRRCGRGGACGLELEDQVAGPDFGIQLDLDAFHHAGGRRGDFHAGLVGLQGDQRLLGCDAVAGLDQDFDDLGLAIRADVRHEDVLHRDGGCRCGGCSRSRGRGRCGGRCSSLGWSRGGRSGASNAQLEDQGAGADVVIQLDLDALHHACGRGGDLHAGLVGFQGDQRLLGGDGIAGLDQDFDDLGGAVRADVRHEDFLHAGGGGRRGGGLCRCGGGLLFSLGRGSCSLSGRRGSGTLDFQFQQFVAFLEAVAQLDLQALDHAGLGSRDFHAGLVRFQGQQALFGFDAVANLDEQLDHFTFAAADVGYANQFTHNASPQQSSGLRFSGSMPNLAMASATTLGSISPRSARASRAARATQ
ncbi:hypothetical protein D9M71_270160 [compost metagenome]